MKFDRRFDDFHVNYKPLNVFTIAALVLLILKLCGVAHFSWWWVVGVWFAPLLFVIAFLGVIAVIGLIAVVIAAICKI